MIKLIIFIIIVIAVMSYFNISVRSIVESNSVQGNFSYVWNNVSSGSSYLWNGYLIGPARYLWYDVFVNLLWDSFFENLGRIKDGVPIDMVENAPQSEF